MGKQLQFDDAARNALRTGVEKLTGAVRVTLGPRGRNVVIERGGNTPIITNDGLTIAKEIELADRFENMGAQMVKEVAAKTGEIAGDGTTTATLLAHAIVSRGLQAIAAGHGPMAIKRGIERAVDAVVVHLKANSRPVEGRADIERIATVSANGDPAMGAMVADALERVGRQGVVTVEEGRGVETTLEVVEGLQFEGGYLSPYFVTNPDSMEAVLDRPLLVLADQKIGAVQDLLPALELAAGQKRPLLLVAEDVEGEALAMLVVNRLRGTVGSAAVKAPGVGDRRRELLDDLAVLTGAQLVTPDLGRRLDRFAAAEFGRATRVRVDHDRTTIVEGGGDPNAIRLRIAQLERAIVEADSDHERGRLRDRLGRLTGGVAVIRVGAATEPDMKERTARFEDALAATRAAVEEGVVPGGGVALVRARAAIDRLRPREADQKVGARIVYESLAEPLRQIAQNAGAEPDVILARVSAEHGAIGFNAVTGALEDLMKAGVMDPLKVTRCALQNAASIGALVLTTDAIVVESDEEEGPPDAEG